VFDTINGITLPVLLQVYISIKLNSEKKPGYATNFGNYTYRVQITA